MSTKGLVIFLVVVIAAGLGLYFIGANDQQTAPASPVSGTNNNSLVTGRESPVVEELQELSGQNMVEITAEGFSPKEIRVKAGATVTWVNQDSAPHWPATAQHPTHLVYPGSDIKKCGTSEAGSIFDACKGLGMGESYSFKFDNTGTWNYHDHLNARAPFFGSVVVE